MLGHFSVELPAAGLLLSFSGVFVSVFTCKQENREYTSWPLIPAFHLFLIMSC